MTTLFSLTIKIYLFFYSICKRHDLLLISQLFVCLGKTFSSFYCVFIFSFLLLIHFSEECLNVLETFSLSVSSSMLISVSACCFEVLSLTTCYCNLVMGASKPHSNSQKTDDDHAPVWLNTFQFQSSNTSEWMVVSLGTLRMTGLP